MQTIRGFVPLPCPSDVAIVYFCVSCFVNNDFKMENNKDVYLGYIPIIYQLFKCFLPFLVVLILFLIIIFVMEFFFR